MSTNAAQVSEVDQESLTERMARGRLPLAEALRYARSPRLSATCICTVWLTAR